MDPSTTSLTVCRRIHWPRTDTYYCDRNLRLIGPSRSLPVDEGALRYVWYVISLVIYRRRETRPFGDLKPAFGTLMHSPTPWQWNRTTGAPISLVSAKHNEEKVPEPEEKRSGGPNTENAMPQCPTRCRLAPAL